MISTFKNELSKNQEGMKGIIDKLLETKDKSVSNSTDLAKAKISQDVAKYKIKSNYSILIIYY